jgi:hypothetical protein
MSPQTNRPARLRHRAASLNSTSRAGFSCAHRRDRGRQVHPDRRAAAGRRAPAPTQGHSARRRQPRPTCAAPSSTRPPALTRLAGTGRPRQPATPCCCAAPSTPQGKSRAWINGSPATATHSCAKLGEQLVDIHGQHAWQSLTRPDSVRALLDGYAGVDLKRDRPAMWQRWRTSPENAHRRACSSGQPATRTRTNLAWQIGEVEKLSPGDDEWDELNTEHMPCCPMRRTLLEAAQSAHWICLKAMTSPVRPRKTLQGALNQLLQNQEQRCEPEFGGHG